MLTHVHSALQPQQEASCTNVQGRPPTFSRRRKAPPMSELARQPNTRTFRLLFRGVRNSDFRRFLISLAAVEQRRFPQNRSCKFRTTFRTQRECGRLRRRITSARSYRRGAERKAGEARLQSSTANPSRCRSAPELTCSSTTPSLTFQINRERLYYVAPSFFSRYFLCQSAASCRW